MVVGIRWHARSGQGAVTAAKALAEAALAEGRYIQASPEYGPERSGAPIKAYNRLSNRPIQIRSLVTAPDLVVVLDPTLLFSEDVLEGTPQEAKILINTPVSPGEVRVQLQASGRRLYALDATKIALEEIGRPFPNTPMLGALAKISGCVRLEGVLEQVRANLGRKVQPKTLEGNLLALKRGYEEVRGEGHD